MPENDILEDAEAGRPDRCVVVDDAVVDEDDVVVDDVFECNLFSK